MDCRCLNLNLNLNLFELSCIVYFHLMSLRSMGSLNGVESRWVAAGTGGGFHVACD